mgnify:CR=1 FL=1
MQAEQRELSRQRERQSAAAASKARFDCSRSARIDIAAAVAGAAADTPQRPEAELARSPFELGTAAVADTSAAADIAGIEVHRQVAGVVAFARIAVVAVAAGVVVAPAPVP